MEIEPQEQIRELAYRIWQEEGYPHGYDVQHWLKAEQSGRKSIARKANQNDLSL